MQVSGGKDSLSQAGTFRVGGFIARALLFETSRETISTPSLSHTLSREKVLAITLWAIWMSRFGII
jgi:hypothetical protein